MPQVPLACLWEVKQKHLIVVLEATKRMLGWMAWHGCWENRWIEMKIGTSSKISKCWVSKCLVRFFSTAFVSLCVRSHCNYENADNAQANIMSNIFLQTMYDIFFFFYIQCPGKHSEDLSHLWSRGCHSCRHSWLHLSVNSVSFVCLFYTDHIFGRFVAHWTMKPSPDFVH